MAVFVVLGGAHKELGENIDLEINPGGLVQTLV